MECENNKEVCNSRNVIESYTNRCNNSRMTSGLPNCYMFGHAYVPNQVYNGNSFNPEQGLQNGTMFPELVSPYMPLDSMKVINALRTERRN